MPQKSLLVPLPAFVYVFREHASTKIWIWIQICPNEKKDPDPLQMIRSPDFNVNFLCVALLQSENRRGVCRYSPDTLKQGIDCLSCLSCAKADYPTSSPLYTQTKDKTWISLWLRRIFFGKFFTFFCPKYLRWLWHAQCAHLV